MIQGATTASAAVLELEGITVETTGRLRLIEDVSLTLVPGRILGVVGESGAGKSLTGAALLSLLDPPLRQSAGTIRLGGRLVTPGTTLRRGRDVGMIFQDPLTALNPLFTIGHQLIETISLHHPVSPSEARARAAALLGEVGIGAAAERLDQYPHELSGGLRQRVVIALALAPDPGALVADEPTTALDVSVQAQIIALLRRLCDERGMAVMLITHDMGVIAEAADTVAVMYAGRVVESGPVAAVLNRPRHPYSAGLLAATPELGQGHVRLPQIEGMAPRAGQSPGGCAFHPRCTRRLERCGREVPPLHSSEEARIACWNPVDG